MSSQRKAPSTVAAAIARDRQARRAGRAAMIAAAALVLLSCITGIIPPTDAEFRDANHEIR